MRSRGTRAVAVLATLAAAGCLDRNAMPLLEVPPTALSGEWLAIVLSGDGGWAATDAESAAALLRHDFPTVGLNSLRYFWFERTPERASAVLRDMLEDTLARWRRQRAVVIGFSRGANTAPFMVDGLPQELKRHVGLVALLSPSIETDFEFHLRDWLSSKAHPDSIPVAPAVEKLRPISTLCVYGLDDEDALCRTCPPARPRPSACPAATTSTARRIES